ncbi:TetR/AcrR family transcriptional regulator [Nonomuraea sp. NPDC046802]|uniref:TetR/AcrR family transcriptional regulator n=1 Tax=Nonomuraea sp. NPDC046802 TaxID=3154919 RepID=UPI0033E9C6E9
MSESPAPVAPELVEAAVRAARRLGKDVSEVPVLTIAKEAGVSRATLLRKLGGTRHRLDEAVRAAGIDPGRRNPVSERAIEAGAQLIAEQGLTGVTLEAVAAGARCSVHSLYVAFGGRDELLRAIFEKYAAGLDVSQALSDPDRDLPDTVHRLYRLLAQGLDHRPRLAPAMIARLLAQPSDDGLKQLAELVGPRLFNGVTEWLASEVARGRIRDLPVPILMHQLIGPVLHHFLLRPVSELVPGLVLPSMEEACEYFADAFLRAVALPPLSDQPAKEK